MKNRRERYGELARTLKGAPAHAAWATLPATANAIAALDSRGDHAVISRAMGGVHKVRSFYNNILDPDSANGDVTIDTHAIGAALLRPLAGGDTAVMHGLSTSPKGEKKPPGFEGASSSIRTGSMGLYGLYADAYRELAGELGIQPRQLQSVVWEAKRAIFDGRQFDKPTG